MHILQKMAIFVAPIPYRKIILIFINQPIMAKNTEIEFDEIEKSLVEKAKVYCAQGEQCVASVRKKLFDWGANIPIADKIVNYLCQNDFINEERFAELYAASKLHNNKWGRNKIYYQMIQKHISRQYIDAAIKKLDMEEYNTILESLAQEKWQQYGGQATRQMVNKVTAFLIGKGFEAEESKSISQKVINPAEE